MSNQGENGGETPTNAGRKSAEPDKRFGDLSARIAAERRDAEHATKAPGARTTAVGSKFGAAFRVGSEFVAAVLVGGGLGYLIDSLFCTLPFGLIIMLLVAFAAGILNMARASGKAPKASDRLNDGD